MAGREKEIDIPTEGQIPLGSIIRAKRQSLGMSLGELASRAGGYDQSHLSSIENGLKPVNKVIFPKIAMALESDPDNLRNATRSEINEWLVRRNQADKKQFPQRINSEEQMINLLEGKGSRTDLLRALEWYSRRITEITRKLTD